MLNLCKTLRKTLWEKCEKFSTRHTNAFLHEILHDLIDIISTNILGGFPLLNLGFTQFPQSLLLLFNI